MVEFELTEEQLLMQKTAHEFAEREMRPISLEYDKKGVIPWPVVQKAHDIQLDTAFLPAEYGGGRVGFGRPERGAGSFGLRAFVVEKGNPGLKQGRGEDKRGVRRSHTAEVILDDCRIPIDNMLGGEDRTAFYGAMKTLESSRPLVA